MTASADDAVRRLGRLDSCAVSDAMDKLGLAGAVSGLSPRTGAHRIAGRVVTYRLVRVDEAPARSGPPRHLGTTAIEMAQPGDIIVAEQRTGLDAGTWGGILSVGASVRGVAGVIADGPVRDIDEAHELGFPVFANATTARTARGRVAEADTGGPVNICGITVHTGDYAIADGTGVVFIPQADIARVLDAAERIAQREALMAAALRKGRSITEVMGADYEHMLDPGKDRS